MILNIFLIALYLRLVGIRHFPVLLLHLFNVKLKLVLFSLKHVKLLHTQQMAQLLQLFIFLVRINLMVQQHVLVVVYFNFLFNERTFKSLKFIRKFLVRLISVLGFTVNSQH